MLTENIYNQGTSLVAQWLGFQASKSGRGFPGQGTRTQHATQHSQKKKKNAHVKIYGMQLKSHLHGNLKL